MSSDVLLEEFEVLESIYPTELSKLSERDIEIEVEPDDLVDGAEPLLATLALHFTEEYPDTLPELTLTPIDDSLEESEIETLLTDLRVVAEENLGMAMTFTLVSHLREQLSTLVRARIEKRKREDAEKERLALEAEEARTRGTPVTVESFRAWKAAFDRELALKKAREDEERTKGISAKEKEEWKKMASRYTGRQLFERDRNLGEGEIPDDDNVVSVDFSQYERTRLEEEEAEDEHVTFSDSD